MCMAGLIHVPGNPLELVVVSVKCHSVIVVSRRNQRYVEAIQGPDESISGRAVKTVSCCGRLSSHDEGDLRKPTLKLRKRLYGTCIQLTKSFRRRLSFLQYCV